METAVFHQYAERLHSFCKATLTEIEERHPGLSQPFPETAFGALTFNFGPDACTYPHKDMKNLSWGWCSVTALGEFDYRKGGHLVLWDMGIAVEFPAHSTILIPSAVVEHSNTAIGEGEKRQSATQYTAGGLFGWRAHGFGPVGVSKRAEKKPEEWWSAPKHMFSNMT